MTMIYDDVNGDGFTGEQLPENIRNKIYEGNKDNWNEVMNQIGFLIEERGGESYEEEQRRFVEAIKNHKSPYGRNSYKHQLLIELYTGMRMGEINALRPCDGDFKNNIIRIRGTISNLL